MKPFGPIMAVCCLAFGNISGEIFAAEFPSSGNIIVTAADATVQISDESPRPVPTATVLAYSRTNQQWLWIDSLWGWIDRSQVVLLEHAEDHYEEIIRVAKANNQPVGVALHHRGIARLALGKNKLALKDFDDAIQAGFETPNLYINRGQAFSQLGKTDEAIESFTTAIAQDPQNGLAYDARAVSLAAKGYLDAALGDADRAVELAPEDARVWYDRALLKQQDSKFKQAIEDYNKAIQLSPRYVEAVTNRGYCLKKMKRFKEAAEDYGKAITIAPDLDVAQNDLAWLLATCPDKSVRNANEAVNLASAAVETTKSKNGQYLDTLAAAYAANGQWDEAVATARKAVKLLEGADQFAADQRLSGYLSKKPFTE